MALHTDLAPTVLEMAILPFPKSVNGTVQKPFEGVSMAYTFDKANADAASTRKTQYFEMMSNRGVKVWPGGHAETFCSDHWRCRFLSDAGGSGVSHAQVISLLTRFADAGFVKRHASSERCACRP